MAKSDKDFYFREDLSSAAVELGLVVNFRELGIHPEFMSDEKIKQLIVQELSEVLKFSLGLSVACCKIELNKTIFSKSILRTPDPEEKDFE